MTRKTYADPAQQAVADAAFDEALRKILALESLPGVTPAMAASFFERGLDVEDVRRLSPEEVMRRALRLQ